MDTFIKTAGKLTVPLGLLYNLSWIIAGVWLAILGEWGTIVYGAVAFFISIFGLVSALMPGMLFVGPAAALNKKGKIKGYFIFGFLGVFYSMIVLSTWCIGVIYLFSKQARNEAAIPTLFWAYGVAIGPILRISGNDLQSGDKYATVSILFAQVACLAVILANLFIRVPLPGNIILFAAVMSVGLRIQFRTARDEIKPGFSS